jgi:hypothetical protein
LDGALSPRDPLEQRQYDHRISGHHRHSRHHVDHGYINELIGMHTALGSFVAGILVGNLLF